jgi:tetratricopeptide (TPR) repeat protein
MKRVGANSKSRFSSGPRPTLISLQVIRPFIMRHWLSFLTSLARLVAILALATVACAVARAADSSVTESAPAPVTAPNAPASPGTPSVSGSTEPNYGGDSNEARARALVSAAINLTDSDRAVKLLWQATEIDPTLPEPYIYLGLYYNSRSNFGKVVEVYQKLIKFEPKEVSAYLNIGEAYMSFQPPKMDEAMPYYRKALEVDPTSSFAALRLGEILAQQGNREEAVKFLRLASADRAKNPDVADQADKYLHDIGS